MTQRRKPRPTSWRFCTVLSLRFKVQIWKMLGLSQPSRKAECEKIKRVGSSKDSKRSLIDTKKDEDVDSLFRPGGTSALEGDISGLEDFELVCFFAVREL